MLHSLLARKEVPVQEKRLQNTRRFFATVRSIQNTRWFPATIRSIQAVLLSELPFSATIGLLVIMRSMRYDADGSGKWEASVETKHESKRILRLVIAKKWQEEQQRCPSEDAL